MKNLFSLRSTV